MCSVFDNEEVGSGTKQGAGSTFGADVLKYNVAQKYTTDARSAAPEKAAYIYAGQIRDELEFLCLEVTLVERFVDMEFIHRPMMDT